MKKIVLLIVFGVSIALPAFAQYQTFSRTSNGTNAITVPNGEVWQVANWSAVGDYNYAYFALAMGGEDLTFYGTSGAFLSIENPASSQPIGLIIQGPATLRARAQLSNTDFAYFMVIKKLSTSPSANSVSSTAVVIPTNSAGDVDVKLEQSADNVTWTECLPGTYNSSTVKRFFRLRAVEK